MARQTAVVGLPWGLQLIPKASLRTDSSPVYVVQIAMMRVACVRSRFAFLSFLFLFVDIFYKDEPLLIFSYWHSRFLFVFLFCHFSFLFSFYLFIFFDTPVACIASTYMSIFLSLSEKIRGNKDTVLEKIPK